MLLLVPRDGITLFKISYRITVDAQQLATYLKDNLQQSKQPHDIYHVTTKLFFSGENKLQKRKLPDIVMNGPSEEVVQKVHVKDYSKV